MGIFFRKTGFIQTSVLLILICSIGLFPHIGLAQNSQAGNLLTLAKMEFKKDYENQDYKKSVQYLEEALKLEPDNPEILYFLGYASDRAVAKDGESLLAATVQNTIKTSSYFEKLNTISPRYTGEIVAQDPYSKINSIWASLALRYYKEDKRDSLIWAFQQSKLRGGLRPYSLATARAYMDACAPNSIVISSGDNIGFSLFYLQEIEKYRTDITLIENGLIYSHWYPAMLYRKKKVNFSLSADAIDSVSHIPFEEENISIAYGSDGDRLRWTLKPQMESYLLRGSRLLLDILQTNKFRKPVYFTWGFPEGEQLSLESNFQNFGIVNKVVVDKESPVVSQGLYDAIAAVRHIDGRSPDEDDIAASIRILGLQMVYYLIQDDHKEEAKKIFDFIQTTMPAKSFPYKTESSEQFLKYLKKELK